MDAMGLSNKKPNSVSTSHSGSFAPNNPDLAKAAGIVSVTPSSPQLPPASEAQPRLLPLPWYLWPAWVLDSVWPLLSIGVQCPGHDLGVLRACSSPPPPRPGPLFR